MSIEVKDFTVANAEFSTEVEGIGLVKKINKKDPLRVECSVLGCSQKFDTSWKGEVTGKGRFIYAKDTDGVEFSIVQNHNINSKKDMLEIDNFIGKQIKLTPWIKSDTEIFGVSYGDLSKGTEEYPSKHLVRMSASATLEVLGDAKFLPEPKDDDIPF